ncbi:MAG: GDP-mannose 4,6-dehydratase, partial [Firmicutes bacterium]|nr:GDP-mannose 4,6-dehydratase [Bacillota bacterium]
MKKVLIIGGAGFVGYHLIRHLQGDLGWGVSATKLPNEHLAMSGVEIFDLDILQKDQIVTLFMKTRPDAIFHLAAQSSVALSWKNPALTVDVNVKGAVQVLEAARALDYKPRLL